MTAAALTVATGGRTLFSLPGDWIDATGTPRARPAIRRIAVVKPDHIGDLLIAAPAFALLRHYFPRAAIELVCGPWNVALARRLGYFDAIHGVDLFHEVSGQQSEPEVAAAARRQGIETLAGLALGPFDLAIDLRHDADSRPILLSIDAVVRAGYGSTREFPFLDIVLPMHAGGGTAGQPSEAVLGGHQFHGGSAATEDSAGGAIEAERSSIELDLAITGAKSPADCGTFPDDRRPLGIALLSLVLQPLGAGRREPVELLPWDPRVSLVSGWDRPEQWGIWGIGGACRLRIALPPSEGETTLRLDVALQAHVNPANPRIACTASAAGGPPTPPVRFVFPEDQAVLSLDVARVEPEARLVSEPFRLAPGDYEGRLRLTIPGSVTPDMALRIGLRGQSSHALLMQQTASRELRQGVCDIAFACRVESGEERLVAEVATGAPRAFAGTRVQILTLVRVRPIKAGTPVAHMEQLARMLVLRVAMEFSEVAPFGRSDELAARLAARAPGATPALETLRARMAAWQRDGACVVGLALGCNSEIRKWPLPYFIETARALLALRRVVLVFLGSAAERAEAEAACDALGLDPERHVLCGAVKLPELGRLMQPLDLFIASNTGSAHYAGRVGVRTIGVYAGTNHPREWAPVGEHTSWLYRDEACAVCSLTLMKDCRYGHACLANLLPRDVLAIAVPEVLAVLSRRAAAVA